MTMTNADNATPARLGDGQSDGRRSARATTSARHDITGSAPTRRTPPTHPVSRWTAATVRADVTDAGCGP